MGNLFEIVGSSIVDFLGMSVWAIYLIGIVAAAIAGLVSHFRS